MQPAGSTSGRPDDRTERPRFRQDLFAELVDEHGGRFIDVMDPDSGNIFRFYEVEYSLACGMDGERDVAGIVRWAQEELGLSPSQQEVRSVISTLQECGFIDAGAAAQPAGADLAADLIPGVVVGAPIKTPLPAQAAQFDLGHAGGAPSRTPPVTPAPAPEFALGAPGAASKRPVDPVEDVALGAPGRAPARPTPAGQPVAAASASSGAGDLSLDLADHIPVGRADVQEAVRASRVMSAVEVPQSVLDAIEDRPTSPAASPGFDSPPHGVRVPEPRRDLPVPPPPRELREARIEVKPPDRVGKSPPAARSPSGPLKPPVELPRQPMPPEPAPVPEPPSGSKVSRVLVGLLILAAVAVGAYLASRFLFGKTETPETSAEQTPSKPVTPPPEPPPPPPPPPPVTAKVAMETPPVDELKADHAGVIETILADKSTVKAGDVIAKLVGDKPIEAELASIGRDVKRLTDQIDAVNQKLSAAQAAGNKNSETAVTAQLETLKKSLATKHDLQATKTTDLDKFLMHAPTAGTFTPAVKLGKKIAANDVVATIQRDPKPVATFKVPDAKPFTANASVDLGFATNDQHVTCVVAEVQEGSIKVACPSDPALVEGADVTLKTNMAQPAPSDPAPPAAPPAAGSDGSAAAGSSGTAPLPTTAPTAPAPPSPSPGP